MKPCQTRSRRRQADPTTNDSPKKTKVKKAKSAKKAAKAKSDKKTKKAKPSKNDIVAALRSIKAFI